MGARETQAAGQFSSGNGNANKGCGYPIGDRVLEVAAGTGEQAVVIAQIVGSNGHVVATDSSPNMLAHAENAAREAGLNNIETRVMNAEALEFEENSFNAVICRMALMLFGNPLTALTEMHRVVKLGSKVAVMVWSSADRNPFHGLPLREFLGAFENCDLPVIECPFPPLSIYLVFAN